MSVSGPSNSTPVQSAQLPQPVRPHQHVGSQALAANAGGQNSANRNSVATVAQGAAPAANARRGSIINIVV